MAAGGSSEILHGHMSTDDLPFHYLHEETYRQIQAIWRQIRRHFMVFASRNMEDELLRLITFLHFPSHTGQDIRALAISGFYYFGESDTVVCYCCGLWKRNWRQTDDPWEIHRRLSSECRFIVTNRHVNRQYYSTLEDRFGYFEICSDLHTLRVPFHVSGPSLVRFQNDTQAEIISLADQAQRFRHNNLTVERVEIGYSLPEAALQMTGLNAGHLYIADIGIDSFETGSIESRMIRFENSTTSNSFHSGRSDMLGHISNLSACTSFSVSQTTDITRTPNTTSIDDNSDDNSKHQVNLGMITQREDVNERCNSDDETQVVNTNLPHNNGLQQTGDFDESLDEETVPKQVLTDFVNDSLYRNTSAPLPQTCLDHDTNYIYAERPNNYEDFHETGSGFTEIWSPKPQREISAKTDQTVETEKGKCQSGLRHHKDGEIDSECLFVSSDTNLQEKISEETSAKCNNSGKIPNETQSSNEPLQTGVCEVKEKSVSEVSDRTNPISNTEIKTICTNNGVATSSRCNNEHCPSSENKQDKYANYKTNPIQLRDFGTQTVEPDRGFKNNLVSTLNFNVNDKTILTTPENDTDAQTNEPVLCVDLTPNKNGEETEVYQNHSLSTGEHVPPDTLDGDKQELSKGSFAEQNGHDGTKLMNTGKNTCMISVRSKSKGTYRTGSLSVTDSRQNGINKLASEFTSIQHVNTSSTKDTGISTPVHMHNKGYESDSFGKATWKQHEVKFRARHLSEGDSPQNLITLGSMYRLENQPNAENRRRSFRNNSSSPSDQLKSALKSADAQDSRESGCRSAGNLHVALRDPENCSLGKGICKKPEVRSRARHLSEGDSPTSIITLGSRYRLENQPNAENRRRSFRNNSASLSDHFVNTGFEPAGPAGDSLVEEISKPELKTQASDLSEGDNAKDTFILGVRDVAVFTTSPKQTQTNGMVCIRCSSCETEFQYSKLENDIWIAHAKAFPRCDYLLKRKGQDFVQAVIQDETALLQKYQDLFTSETLWKHRTQPRIRKNAEAELSMNNSLPSDDTECLGERLCVDGRTREERPLAKKF